MADMLIKSFAPKCRISVNLRNSPLKKGARGLYKGCMEEKTRIITKNTQYKFVI